MLFAPVELTFRVGVAAVFDVVNNTPIVEPACNVKLAQVTVLADVLEVVAEVPYHDVIVSLSTGVFHVPSLAKKDVVLVPIAIPRFTASVLVALCSVIKI